MLKSLPIDSTYGLRNGLLMSLRLGQRAERIAVLYPESPCHLRPKFSKAPMGPPSFDSIYPLLRLSGSWPL